MALASAAQTRQPAPIEVRTAKGAIETHVLQFGKLPPHPSDETLFDQIGMMPLQHTLPAIIGKVVSGSPAQAAGLRPGDRILSIDGTAVADWNQLTDTTRKLAKPDRKLALVIERAGQRMPLNVQPRLTAEPDGSKVWAMGIYVQPGTAKYDTVLRR